MKNLNIRKGFESPIAKAIKEIEFSFDPNKSRHDIFEREFNERNELSPKVLICFALVKGEKKQIKRPLPEHNLKLKALMASPLNEFVANIGFTYKGRAKYFTKMSTIWAALAGNLNYPLLPVTNTEWNAEKTLYDAAKLAKNTLAADQHFANMIYMSKQNGVYVANTCGNSLIVFNTSGYTANKTSKAPPQSMGKVVIKGAKDTKKSGEVKIEIVEMPGAITYEVMYQLVLLPPPPMVFSCSGPKKRPTLKALPLVAILIFVRAVGPIDTGDWSIGYPYTPR